MLCLFLRAGVERLAVPASSVVEVIPAVKLHVTPGLPTWVAGVFRFRGVVTPVIDLHRVVVSTPCPVRLSTRIVLVSHPTAHGPRPLGLLAEQVTDLKTLAVTGPGTAGLHAGDGPDLGPLVADADGVLRLPAVGRLIPAAFRDALFGTGRDS